jgi:hypothetical protein
MFWMKMKYQMQHQLSVYTQSELFCRLEYNLVFFDMYNRLQPKEDRVLKVYEEHEDSVYKVEWSNIDPWVFASLSYDGRFVINKGIFINHSPSIHTRFCNLKLFCYI